MKTRIRAANKKGTGFIRLKKGVFSLGESLRVKLTSEGKSATFFAAVRDYSGACVYVPKQIVKQTIQRG